MGLNLEEVLNMNQVILSAGCTFVFDEDGYIIDVHVNFL